MDNNREFDIIIFGATGFTGKHLVEEIVKLEQRSKDEYTNFTWAVSGRSEEKLNQILDEVSKYTGSLDLKLKIPKILADISDQESLRKMAKKAKIVLNCVGPYYFYGEKVIEACIEEGTHQLDISAENLFIENIQLKYNQKAIEKGIYIISACGFDSIPNECGVNYLIKNFSGELNSIESFIEFDAMAFKTKINYGTWHSAIYFIASQRELQEVRRQLFPQPLPEPKYKLHRRSIIHSSNVAGGWCIPFPETDTAIVERSQRFFYENENKRPVQFLEYIKTPNLFFAILLFIGGTFFMIFCKFKFTRFLLETFPALFTLGFFTRDGPNREEMNKPFTFTLIGEGWDNPGAKYQTEPPKKKIVAKIKGNNPAYGATCICLLFTALAILKEKDKLPGNGGVLSPGFAFSKTKLIEKLNENGLTFSIVSNDSDNADNDNGKIDFTKL